MKLQIISVITGVIVGFLIGLCFTHNTDMGNSQLTQLTQLTQKVNQQQEIIDKLRNECDGYAAKIKNVQECNALLAQAGMAVLEQVQEQGERLQVLEAKGPRKLFKKEEDSVAYK
jgi:uncharacterized membrane-anchored protein YhcB (DUF1043 family)